MSQSSGQASSDPAGVLVVEDDAEINELVGAYVQIAGYGYRAAHNGDEALREARQGAPALIVLDMMLPDMDGVEVCRRVRDVPGSRDVPVMILSALDAGELAKRSAACQAIKVLTKPFDPDQLIEAVRSCAAPGEPSTR